MKKIILLFLSIIVATFFCFLREDDRSLRDQLKKISPSERKYLEFLFRSSFEYDGLGYVLFGDKPISALAYLEKSPRVDDIYSMLNSVNALEPAELRFMRGVVVWEKYQHLFPMKNFAWIKCKNFIDNEYDSILFINKKALLKIIQQHLDDFRMVLGKNVTPESLLKRILISDDVFGEVLKGHQGLIGTVLGFGRHNAWLFHQREENELNTPLLKKRILPLKKLPIPQAEFSSPLEVFDDRSLLDFNPLFMGLPGFVADPDHEETKQLKIKYERQYREIIHRYQKGDFLEITLKQLISE